MKQQRYYPPKWLDEVAQDYWRKIRPQLGDRVNPSNEDSLAALCHEYSLYRQAVDLRSEKIHFDHWLKLNKEWQITPKSAKALPPVDDELDIEELLNE